MSLVKNLSLRQFAKIAGVSPATVSRAFSKSTNVAKEKRDRIMKLAKQMGFRPNPIARAAFGEETKSVGVLFSHLKSSYFGKIATGIQDILIKDDYLPIVLGVTESSETAVRRMMDHRVDALIIGFSDEQIDLSKVFGSHVPNIPIVVLEHVRHGIICDTVLNDDINGGRLAAEYLLKLGHKRFGFCYFGEGRSNCDLRLQGFREALAKAGLLLPDDNIARHLPYNDNRDQLICQALREILSKEDRPTAIFASSDYLALKVYEVARAMDLRIPRDLSVIGFANLEFTTFVDPPMTTIAQYPEEMGKKAAELILKRLKRENVDNHNIIIPTNLVERLSCAQAK